MMRALAVACVTLAAVCGVAFGVILVGLIVVALFRFGDWLLIHGGFAGLLAGLLVCAMTFAYLADLFDALARRKKKAKAT